MSLPLLRLRKDGNHVLALRGHSDLSGLPLGEILVRNGALSPGRLLAALALQPLRPDRIGTLLLERGWIAETDLANALAFQGGAQHADLAGLPPDSDLIDRLGPANCLRLGLVPWHDDGGLTHVATSRPEAFDRMRPELETALGPVRMWLATAEETIEAVLIHRRGALAAQAEARVPDAESCRSLSGRMAHLAVAGLAATLAAALIAPTAVFALLTAWAVLVLLLTTALRAAAAITQLTHVHRSRSRFRTVRVDPPDRDLPTISLLVPLFREREIAGRLVRRLERLDYPGDRLDICLVVEEDDAVTRHTLSACDLPYWMRQIVVPGGTIRTKPRALNYALDFCRGSIVGVYDAEDAPDPDQLRKVMRRFRDAGPEVACLQGVLDFYNARTNWLSRCFAIDYAAWFRIILPGLARLGFVIPLGGTTLFFRREALDALGGWDAHNVTEDADLGLRLARHGYRTELIDTVTEEEANCRAWPWVRQRSRWLKGYAMTWATHMRAPVRLWRDLGPRGFFGVQILFLGTLSTFVLAPFLWSFWLLPFGLPHPLRGHVQDGLFIALGAIFFATELANVAIGALAVSSAKHRWLVPWVPTMHLYFPLGALASWKAMIELVVRPFYWDKTAHGLTDPARGISSVRWPWRRRS